MTNMEQPGAAGTWQCSREESVSDTLFRALAEGTEKPLDELPPLQESVDLDSIDRAFAASPEIESVTFGYAGYRVVVEPTQIHLRARV